MIKKCKKVNKFIETDDYFHKEKCLRRKIYNKGKICFFALFVTVNIIKLGHLK